MIRLQDVKNKLVSGLYEFDYNRRRYGLCSSNTGFFQPFKSFLDGQQQVKTALVAPIIGLGNVLGNMTGLIKNVLLIAISVPCLSPDLFVDGLVSSATNIEAGVVNPVVALVVSAAAVISIFTRLAATLLSYDGGAFKNDWLAFLPDNPYANIPYNA